MFRIDRGGAAGRSTGCRASRPADGALRSAAFVLLLLAGLPALAADADRGAKIFKKCVSCHALGKGAEEVKRIGPHLNGIFGRRAGVIAGYKYSKAMRRASADGLVWDTAALDIYIENPKNLVSRTRMNFAGIAAEDERADLLAYLRSFSDNPRDIPEAEPTATRTDPEPPAELIALVGDVDYGEYLAGECLTCHQPDGEDKGIPSITGWPTEDFVRAMHAYKVKARPHPVMRMIAGSLADEEIAALAAFFEAVE